MDSNDQNLFDLQIDREIITYLGDAAKWGKFLSIIGFIFCGFLVIFAFLAGSKMATSLAQLSVGTEAMPGSFITAIYLVVALIYFFPCLYLFNFSAKMQRALQSNDQLSLAEAFKNLKSCYKFLGILTIILLSFYVLAILAGIIGAVSS